MLHMLLILEKKIYNMFIRQWNQKVVRDLNHFYDTVPKPSLVYDENEQYTAESLARRAKYDAKKNKLINRFLGMKVEA